MRIAARFFTAVFLPNFLVACYSVGKSYVNGIQIACQIVHAHPDTSSAEIRPERHAQHLGRVSSNRGYYAVSRGGNVLIQAEKVLRVVLSFYGAQALPSISICL